MDIKTLLLKSLSVKRPLYGSRRIHCGKSCIIIKYVLNGHILNIKTIKINRTHETWAQRMKYYKKYLRTYRSTNSNSHPRKGNLPNTFLSEKQDKETLTEYLTKHTKDVQTEKLSISSITKHSSAQTIAVQKQAKEIQTDAQKPPQKLKEMFKLSSTTKTKQMSNQPVALTSTAQQTIASARFSRSMSFNNKIIFCSKTTSTSVINIEHKAVQCKRHTQTKASNTHSNTRDSCAQVENDLAAESNSLQEELKRRFPLPAEDFGVFIFMLNEIGETVVNQNEILKSNTEMMKQIMQISMLQNSKRVNNSSYRSISTQTDKLANVDTRDNFCQTHTECVKQRKIMLFKGRNSQNKKN